MKKILFLSLALILTGCEEYPPTPTSTKIIKYYNAESKTTSSVPNFVGHRNDTYVSYKCVDDEAVKLYIDKLRNSIVSVETVGEKCVEIDINLEDKLNKLATTTGEKLET